MKYSDLLAEENAWVAERLALAEDRIRQLAVSGVEADLEDRIQDYIRNLAGFMCRVLDQRQDLLMDMPVAYSKERNVWLYEDVVGEAYETSYANPAYAAERLGSHLGRYLCFLAFEIRGMIRYAFTHRDLALTMCMEIFLETVGILTDGGMDGLEEKSLAHHIQQALYYYIHDYADMVLDYKAGQALDPDYARIRDLVMTADLSDRGYLYRYGDHISTEAEMTSDFLRSLPQETIDLMADTLVKGYRRGFDYMGSDLSDMEVAGVRFVFGYERVIKRVMEILEADGHRLICLRPGVSLLDRMNRNRKSCCDLCENPQMDYDHRNDMALFLDSHMRDRILSAYRNGYQSRAELASSYAGPVMLETWGEPAFFPENKQEVPGFGKKQLKLFNQLKNAMERITYDHIRGDETSYAIISFPTPAIGDRFPEIFQETIRLNTLDNDVYTRIQQCMIDVLDQCSKVVVEGCGDNRTRLEISLCRLTDPAKETIFENCVADVNIPVGEVFTSPRLTGTRGRLHVSQVYLGGLCYKNLFIDVEDGMIVDYGCDNYEDPDASRDLIHQQILYGHDSLPMGEFAIGTNTQAYRMAKNYQIFDRLKILIAEKTGPHFAFGDTCYSHAEDKKVYNLNGKEIIARDNEVSVLRKTEAESAYYGCHTDITIPYEELGCIYGVTPDGTICRIIENGRFVLAGTEILNEALEGIV